MFSLLPHLFVLLALHLYQPVQGDCGDITRTDMLGPFYEEDADLDLKIAPDNELKDPSISVRLEGSVSYNVSLMIRHNVSIF